MTQVVTQTTVSHGFTVTGTPKAWCVVRGLSRAAIEGLAAEPPTHPLIVKADLARLGEQNVLATLVEALLDHSRKGSIRPLCGLLGRFIEDGALLAPLTGVGQGLPTILFNSGLPAFIDDVLQRSNILDATANTRRAISHLWLCTIEAKMKVTGRNELAGFVLVHLQKKKQGKWLQGIPHRLQEGFMNLAIALEIKDATTKWARLDDVVNAFHKSSDGQEWKELWLNWLNEKQPGAMIRYERAYTLLAVYLTDNLEVAPVEKLFLRSVPRLGLFEFITAYQADDSARCDFLRKTSEFFVWILENDDRFSATDYVSDERIVREQYFLPIKRSQIDELSKNRQSRPAETVQMALPMEYLGEIETILTENDMAWPKLRKSDWIVPRTSTSNPAQPVYCPVLPNLVRLLLKLPLRHVQARRLDSGEGDALMYRMDQQEWTPNTGTHAGYWQSSGARNMERGALRRIVDGWTGETLCGFYVNSNKTADKKTNFDETSGYVIAWQNEEAIEIVSETRDWQERWNALERPTRYVDVRAGVFEKMHEKSAARRPDCFFLFRYPGGYSGRFRESPPTGSQLRAFWYEVLAELERRLRARNENPPELISSWQGDVPTASAYTLHGLRHSGLTRLAQAGVHPWILKNIVAGHSDYVMTLYYIKPSPAHISAHLNERYMEALRNKQTEFKQFLASRTLEEVHRVAVSRSNDAFVALDAIRRSVGNAASVMSSTDDGICPNGRSRCDEGIKLDEQIRIKRRATDGLWGPVPQIDGVPDCTQCRFFITGTPFIDGLRIKTNEVAVAAASCAERYRSMSATISQLESERIRALEHGNEWDHTKQQSLSILKQQIKSEAEAVTTYATSLHSHGELFQQVRALLRLQQGSLEPNAPALLFTELPTFEWGLLPRFEAIDELVHAAKWYPSIRSDALRRERDQAVVRMLVRQGAPTIVVALSEEESKIAIDAITAFLFIRLGRAQARRVFSNEVSLEELGLVDSVEAVLTRAIGQEVKLSLNGDSNQEIGKRIQVTKLLKKGT